MKPTDTMMAGGTCPECGINQRACYTQAELDAAVQAERDKWRDLLGRYVQHVGEAEGTDFLDYEYPEGSLCWREDEWLRPEDHAAIAETAIDLCAAIRERGK